MTRKEKIVAAREQYEAIRRFALGLYELIERPAWEQCKAVERDAKDD